MTIMVKSKIIVGVKIDAANRAEMMEKLLRVTGIILAVEDAAIPSLA